MSLILTIPPYAAGQYGWDPLESVCWYTNDNHQQRLAWQIGTQLFWIALTVTGEVVTACTVTVYMLRARYRQKRIFSAATLSRSSHSSQPQRKNRSLFNSSITSLKPTSIHANTYAHVIARIALYPAASCVINMTSVVTVMHSTTSNGIQNANDYDILLLSDFLYGGRVIVYAILAATDMALIRAVRAFVAHHMHWNWGSTTISRSHTATGTRISAAQAHRKGLAVQVELSTFVSSDCADGGSRANLATDSKTRHDIESTQEAIEDSTGGLGEDVQIPPPAMDKAERGVLTDLKHTDEPSLNQPRTVAFQLSSPITSSSQSILHRQEEMVREQAEEEEFMRII
ncbi:hypothetical protein PENSPDRAFT_679527 [Peniophora sp. CONT]|nr:hypothetical protein PENSPDRAFT_679527 [Peniophora sp. CONT]